MCDEEEIEVWPGPWFHVYLMGELPTAWHGSTTETPTELRTSLGKEIMTGETKWGDREEVQGKVLETLQAYDFQSMVISIGIYRGAITPPIGQMKMLHEHPPIHFLYPLVHFWVIEGPSKRQGITEDGVPVHYRAYSYTMGNLVTTIHF